MESMISQSIANAKQGISKLTDEILALPGMSSDWNRHLLNNLCEGKSYLEVGTHRGSTLISATYGNKSTGLAYDDYRRFGDHRKEVRFLIKKYECDAKLVCKDGMAHKDNKTYDVIFYDGDHSYDSAINAIHKFINYLPLAGGILIIDDYEYEPTKKAVTDCEYLFTDVILLRANSDNKNNKWDYDGWFNGLALMIL